MIEHPILYTKTSRGALQQWRCWSDHEAVFTEFGLVGGKLQTTPGKVCTATNVGRANERSPEQQAEFEAAALQKFKLERKYSSTPSEAAETVMLPMLATDYLKIKPKDLVFPAWTQIKYDGVRCIAQWEGDEVTLMSRSGKPYVVEHIQESLRNIMLPGCIFDGELMLPGGSCQLTTSLVKNAAHPDRGQLKYFVYDIPQHNEVDGQPWSERVVNLESLFDDIYSDVIVKVTSEVVNSLDEAKSAQQRYVSEGQEGAILRLGHGLYEWGHRSRLLLKVKEFDDGEFSVIGARAGVGKMAAAVVFRCVTAEGKEFDVSMACPMEERERYWREHAQYIGKKLTLRHFGWTDDKIPRFPVGKLFRDEKDLNAI